MDETWEGFEENTYSNISDIPFPFQTILVKFRELICQVRGLEYNRFLPGAVRDVH